MSAIEVATERDKHEKKFPMSGSEDAENPDNFSVAGNVIMTSPPKPNSTSTAAPFRPTVETTERTTTTTTTSSTTATTTTTTSTTITTNTTTTTATSSTTTETTSTTTTTTTTTATTSTTSTTTTTTSKTTTTLAKATTPTLRPTATTFAGVDYEEYEYPTQDIPTRKPYFPLDGIAKEVQRKVPRFETTSEGQKRKEILHLFETNLVDAKAERIDTLHQTGPASPSPPPGSRPTTAASGNPDDRKYGSAGNEPAKEHCHCPCLSPSAANVTAFPVEKTYFPVADDSNGADGESVPGVGSRPGITEAIDLSADAANFFQGPMFYDFLNISPKNLAKNLAFLVQNTANFRKIWIVTLVFKKNVIFCTKLPKIAESCYHNIDP
jgi:hypothetical protein